VRILPAGDSEAFVELFVGFALALLAGVLSVYLVLLLLFHSGTQPIVILAAVPLCGGGAFGLLLLTGTALSLPSLIGLLLLNGIAVKNSILIVDYAILGERAGLSRHDALIDACRKRARPVIMTTLAMGAGMLPIALGFGADGSFRTPLGVSVIGGLITSTLLSLVVIPAAYSMVAEITERSPSGICIRCAIDCFIARRRQSQSRNRYQSIASTNSGRRSVSPPGKS